MRTYHNNASGLATARTEAKPRSPRRESKTRTLATRLRAADTATFTADLRTVARQLYFSTPSASQADRQFLQDVARDDVRVQLKQLQRLIAIAAESTRPEHRLALSELVRRHCDVQRECLDVVIASDHETEVQGAFDSSIRTFERHRTRAAKERALEHGRRHYAALRALLDSIEATPAL
jgi:hypothetical protein